MTVMINYNLDLQKTASYKHTNLDFVLTINVAKTELICILLFIVAIALSCFCSLSMLPTSFYYSLGHSYVYAKGFMNSYFFCIWPLVHTRAMWFSLENNYQFLLFLLCPFFLILLVCSNFFPFICAFCNVNYTAMRASPLFSVSNSVVWTQCP